MILVKVGPSLAAGDSDTPQTLTKKQPEKVERAAERWDTLYRDLDDRRANLEPGIDALVARDHA